MIQRLLTPVICTSVLLGCGKRPDALGSFHAINDWLATKGCSSTPGSIETDVVCELAIAGAECPCRRVVSVRPAGNGTDADVIRIRIAHCDHDVAVKAASEVLARWIPEEPLVRELDRSAGDLSSPVYSAVSLSHYGDLRTSIRWWRDFFAVDDGPPVMQPTATYEIEIEARREDEDDSVHTFSTPIIAAVPRCHGTVAIPAGPAVGTQVCGSPQETVLPAFEIDRDVVSCDDYQACVEARACHEQPGSCRYEAAVVTREAAIAFCAWRHAELPSLVQWQRAIRGRESRRYPSGATWDRASACRHATAADDVSHLGRLRCKNTSSDGVTYYVLDPNEAEWTKDLDCSSERTPLPVAIDIYGEALDRVFLRSPEHWKQGELRCVRAHR